MLLIVIALFADYVRTGFPPPDNRVPRPERRYRHEWSPGLIASTWRTCSGSKISVSTCRLLKYRERYALSATGEGQLPSTAAALPITHIHRQGCAHTGYAVDYYLNAPSPHQVSRTDKVAQPCSDQNVKDRLLFQTRNLCYRHLTGL